MWGISFTLLPSYRQGMNLFYPQIEEWVDPKTVVNVVVSRKVSALLRIIFSRV
jgi:hypothetical protein